MQKTVDQQWTLEIGDKYFINRYARTDPANRSLARVTGTLTTRCCNDAADSYNDQEGY